MSAGLFAQTAQPLAFSKPSIPMAIDDTLQRFDVTFDYSIFNRPYSDLYDFTPRQTIQLEPLTNNKVPLFFAKVGMQYPIIPTAELSFHSRAKDGFSGGLNWHEKAFVGNLPEVLKGGKFDVSEMNNNIGAGLTYDWSNGQFMIDGRYVNDVSSYTYADVDARKHLKHEGSLTMKFNSAYVEDDSIYYDITGSYKRTTLSDIRPLISDTSILSESYLKAAGYVGASFEKHRIYLDMNVEFSLYDGVRNFTAGIVEIAPIYQYSIKWFSTMVGAKFCSSFGIAGTSHNKDKLNLEEEELSGAENSVFPDVDMRFSIIDKTLWIRAAVTGGTEINSFSRMAEGCGPLSVHTPLRAGKRQVDSRLELESLISGRLSLSLSGGFVRHKSKAVFCPVVDADYSIKDVNAAYFDTDQFFSSFDVFWKSNDFTIGGNFAYNWFLDRETRAVLTEFPSWRAGAFIRYNFREKIIASFDINYQSAVSGSMFGHYEVPRILDSNFDINFLINRHFSVFAKCGNIFNQRNQYVPLYVEPGRNFGGGICVIF